MSNIKDLIVWQKSIKLVKITYDICKLLPEYEQFALSSQMRRAAVSIPSNIAEGYRRSSRKEYRHFCSIALGSTSELETQLIITEQIYSEVDTANAYSLCIEVQKILSKIISRL